MIILIAGKQGSGKSTLAKGLCAKLGAVPMKFADILYEMHEVIYNKLKRYGITPPNGAEIDGPLLQVLGTEWGRRRDPDFWVKIMKERVNESLLYDNIVIDDCRFENELMAFPDAIKVRLVADESSRKLRAAKWRENTKHPSETSLDHVPDSAFDLVVNTVNASKEDTLRWTLETIKAVEASKKKPRQS